MSDFKESLDRVLPILNTLAASEAAAALDKLAKKARSPEGRIIMAMMVQALKTQGPEGLMMAEQKIIGLIDGRDVELDFTDLRTGSDALALLQNKEADERTKFKQFVRSISGSLGVAVGSIIEGAVLG